MVRGRGGSASDGRRAAQDEILIQALGAGTSYREAGELAGVAQRTVERRMAVPSFARAVERVQAARVAETTGRLVGLSADALDAIRAELTGAPRSADRLRAATLALRFGLEYRRVHELEARLREVEQLLGLLAPRAGHESEGDDDDVD